MFQFFHSDYPVSPKLDVKLSIYTAETHIYPKEIGIITEPRNIFPIRQINGRTDLTVIAESVLLSLFLFEVGCHRPRHVNFLGRTAQPCSPRENRRIP